MSDLSWLSQELSAAIPATIPRHIAKLSSRRRLASPKTARLIEFVQNKAATTRPHQKTFVALHEIIQDKNQYLWREQIVAVWALGKADLEEDQRKSASQALAYLLDHNGKTHGQWFADSLAQAIWQIMRLGILGVTCCFICFIIALMIAAFDLNPDKTMLIPFAYVGVISIALTIVVPCISVISQTHTTRKIHLEAARALGNLGQAEGVSALLRASQNAVFLQKVGQEALMRTLSSLTFEEHYGALGSDVVPNLCALLNGRSHSGASSVVDWKFALIGALGQVGDARAIHQIMQVLQENSPDAGGSPLLFQKAERVLDVLRKRAARETEQKTLLRGAEAPVGSKTLLRSYEETCETPPEQLLRAAENEEG